MSARRAQRRRGDRVLARADQPLGARVAFDDAFAALCMRHNVRAAYVLVDGLDDDGNPKIALGGDEQICNALGDSGADHA